MARQTKRQIKRLTEGCFGSLSANRAENVPIPPMISQLKRIGAITTYSLPENWAKNSLIISICVTTEDIPVAITR